MAFGTLGKMPRVLVILPSTSYIAVQMRDQSNPRLGNRLRVARAERSLSQTQLADAVGVTRQTISSIETGQYGPSTLLALRIARVLDMPISDLFWIEGDRP
jgi:putative transcriptional regulator